MKTQHIRIRPDRLNVPLAVCCVGKLSSAVFTIGGDIPDDITAVAVHVERMGEGDEVATYAASAAKQSDGTWRCYLSPFYFPEVADNLRYHVIGTDTTDPNVAVPRWLGTGVLRVLDNPANGSVVAPEIIPADTYIRNPTTGLYHLLTATVNEYGDLAVTLSDEGFER